MDSLPTPLRICGDDANLVSTGEGEYDVGIEISGTVYTGQRVSRGDEPQDCSEGCGGTVNSGLILWPEVPICN